MPEIRAKSKKKKDVNKAVSANIHNMAHGPHHGDRVAKQGAAKARLMEIAAAERIARGKKSTKKKKK